MPQTHTELAEQYIALAKKGNLCFLEDKSRKELQDMIASFYFDENKHLPQIHPMCGYDATMDFSKEGDSFWDKYEGEYYAEPKIDEIRMLMFFYKGQVRLQSRGRHKNTQLYHECTENFPWVQELYKPEFEGVIIDGGLVAGIGNRTRNLWVGADLLLAMSMVGSGPERSLGIQKEKGRPRYVAWDLIGYPETMALPKMGWKPVKAPIEVRRQNLLNLATRIGLDVVPQWRRDLKHYYDSVVKSGGEGIMLKRSSASYFFKRDKAWLKVKRYEDVVGYVHSMKSPGNNAWEGLVGSINIADEKGDIIGAVGTMTLERRKELSLPDGPALNPEFVGRKVLIRYYAKHSETGNPRHCRLIGWIGEDIKEEETVKEEQ